MMNRRSRRDERAGWQFSQSPPWWNPQILTSLGSGALLVAGWLTGQVVAPHPVPAVLFGVAIPLGSFYFGREALKDLFFEREIGIELLMTLAAVAAAAMGELGEAATLVFLYSISEAAEGYTEEKTRSAIKALMDLTPKIAIVRRDGCEVELPAEELMPGDLFIVKPGETLATDGEVVLGRSSVDQSAVTGESIPVEKRAGDLVLSGTLNGEGALEVCATKAFHDSTIARIVQMVEEAEERKGVSQRFIERFGARYSPAVLALGISIALLPPLLAGASWATWVARATVFIVAAAPCALVISIPITLVAAIGTAARKGVLIKGGVHLEELAKVNVVGFDKTGTLTRGKPEVTEVVVLSAEPVGAKRALAVAAAIERNSRHPLAHAIVDHAEREGIEPVEVTDFRSLTGVGATAVVGVENGARAKVYVGSPELFSGEFGIGLGAAETEIERLQEAGNTVVLVGDEAGPWALIALRDSLRPEARAVVQALHERGVKIVVMLTGDNARTARAVGRELGLDEIHAELSPEDKAVRVCELAARHGRVAMVGDGVNDAPALAEATVGVAMGAAGTDVALETADVALMADDLEKLVYTLAIAQRTARVVRQNLVLSVCVIGILVAGAVAGAFTLPVAVLGHELSELVVIGSGLRMLRG